MANRLILLLLGLLLAAASIDAQSMSIRVRHSKQYLTAGAKAMDYAFQGSAPHPWTLDKIGKDTFQIRSAQNGLCLDVPGNARTTSPIIQYGCHRGANQQWRLINGAIISESSKLCLDIEGAFTHEGARLMQYQCQNKANQLFDIQPLGKTKQASAPAPAPAPAAPATPPSDVIYVKISTTLNPEVGDAQVLLNGGMDRSSHRQTFKGATPETVTELTNDFFCVHSFHNCACAYVRQGRWEGCKDQYRISKVYPKNSTHNVCKLQVTPLGGCKHVA